MGKYGEAIGIWELRVGGAELDLKPKKGDNLKLSRLLNEVKNKKDEAFLMEQFGLFIKELISKDYPPLDDNERDELDMYVEFNIVELMKETLIAFRWTTREAYDKIEGDALKKVESLSQS